MSIIEWPDGTHNTRGVGYVFAIDAYKMYAATLTLFVKLSRLEQNNPDPHPHPSQKNEIKYK